MKEYFKEYLYRNRVRYQSRRGVILLHLLPALIIIFSGGLLFAVPTYMVFLRVLALSHAQVEYFVPRTEEEMKKQSIANVLMLCGETSVCMLLWLIPSLFLYHRLSDKIHTYPVFTALWLFSMMVLVFNVGLNAERSRFEQGGAEDVSLLRSAKNDMWGTLAGIFKGIVLIFLFGSTFGTGWLGERQYNYQNPVVFVFILITLVLMVIDIYRILQSWAIGNFGEERNEE